MNKLIIFGNIGQDARLGQAASNGSTPISFSVAVSEKRGDNEHTEWFSCTKWVNSGGSTAVAQYLKKGTKVIVEGKVSARAYADKDGNARVSLEVNVQNIQLAGGAVQTQQTAQYQQPTHSPQPQAQPAQTLPNANNLLDDDVPF